MNSHYESFSFGKRRAPLMRCSWALKGREKLFYRTLCYFDWYFLIFNDYGWFSDFGKERFVVPVSLNSPGRSIPQRSQPLVFFLHHLSSLQTIQNSQSFSQNMRSTHNLLPSISPTHRLVIETALSHNNVYARDQAHGCVGEDIMYTSRLSRINKKS